MGSEPTDASWGMFRRILFRFTFVYCVLYILPFPVSEFVSTLSIDKLMEWAFKWILGPYREAWDAVVLWTGQHIFGVEIKFRPAGSGDTTWNYVQVFCLVVISATVTLLWSLIDRRQTNHSRLHELLRIYVRFYLAANMIGYGAVKVIKSQFPTPEADRLLVTYGESSPMRLLWTFMGASDGYNWFTGAGEMIGGLLLCTRRTTLLGALVTFGVMAHVTALNFCYDVPVKLFSTHLVLMSVFLMAPHMKWLFEVFVLGRQVEFPGVQPLTNRPWLNVLLALIRTVAVVSYVGVCLYGAQRSRELFGDLAPKTAPYGLWEVEEFKIDGENRPPRLDDPDRWKHFFVGRQRSTGTFCTIEKLNGTRLFHRIESDPKNQTMILKSTSMPRPGIPQNDAKTEPMTLNYQTPENDILVIEGVYNQQPIHVRLRRVDESQFLLLNRGFHWINEMPPNMALPRGSGKKSK